MAEVETSLLAGRMEAASAHFDGGAMLLVLSRGLVGETPVAWVNYVAGKSTLKPKAWLKEARRIVFELETLARKRGYRELRFGGRPWPLPGYHPFDKRHPHWVRKVLTDG